VHKTPEITRLIHDNFWIVLSFSFGQPAIVRVINDKFAGEWKYLNKTVHERAEMRADRALLEMATQLRVLDDEQKLSDVFKQTKRGPLGTVVQADGTRADLHFRDMTNKVMHGNSYEWKLGSDDPIIVIHSDQPKRWMTAELRVLELMGYLGGIIH
jgi:hypothetical protein